MEKRRNLAKKPERGSFLLDHNNECTLIKDQYLKCLKENNNDHIMCIDYSKKYFLCRMENNLLEKQSLENLGFFENDMNTNKNSRMQNFKDVYSYNVYHEQMEDISKGDYDMNAFSEDTEYKNNMPENERKEEYIQRETETISYDKFSINPKETKANGKIENRNKFPKQRDQFILLNIYEKETIHPPIRNNIVEKNKKNKTQNKIEIKRKEADGYLAGKEYIKMLNEKKKKKKISVFINSLYKRNQEDNVR